MQLRFVLEYQNRFENSDNVLADIRNEAIRLRERMNITEMSEDEILATEIPEGQMFAQVRCIFYGTPSLIRVVRGRDGISYSVDYTWSRSDDAERLDCLRYLLGNIVLDIL